MGNKLGMEDQARWWYLRLRDAVGEDRTRQDFEAWLAQDEKHIECYNAIAAFWTAIEDLPELAAAVEATKGDPDPDLFFKFGDNEPDDNEPDDNEPDDNEKER